MKNKIKIYNKYTLSFLAIACASPCFAVREFSLYDNNSEELYLGENPNESEEWDVDVDNNMDRLREEIKKIYRPIDHHKSDPDLEKIVENPQKYRRKDIPEKRKFLFYILDYLVKEQEKNL